MWVQRHGEESSALAEFVLELGLPAIPASSHMHPPHSSMQGAVHCTLAVSATIHAPAHPHHSPARPAPHPVATYLPHTQFASDREGCRCVESLLGMRRRGLHRLGDRCQGGALPPSLIFPVPLCDLTMNIPPISLLFAQFSYALSFCLCLIRFLSARPHRSAVTPCKKTLCLYTPDM